jgi:hypothetical protein
MNALLSVVPCLPHAAAPLLVLKESVLTRCNTPATSALLASWLLGSAPCGVVPWSGLTCTVGVDLVWHPQVLANQILLLPFTLTEWCRASTLYACKFAACSSSNQVLMLGWYYAHTLSCTQPSGDVTGISLACACNHTVPALNTASSTQVLAQLTALTRLSSLSITSCQLAGEEFSTLHHTALAVCTHGRILNFLLVTGTVW